ncbi:hypothetical protein GCM10020258_51460 [Sphingomonas yabuuchiae]
MERAALVETVILGVEKTERVLGRFLIVHCRLDRLETRVDLVDTRALLIPRMAVAP